VRCAHHEDAIGRALDGLVAAGADLLLVIGASAVVDRRDVGPAGIVRAGGEILHFGMPVDPGNLICLGRIGERPLSRRVPSEERPCRSRVMHGG